MNTDAPPPSSPKTSRRRPAVVVPFDPAARHAPPPRRAEGPELRPLYAAPGFLSAVRHARAFAPDLTREEVIAAARARGPWRVVVWQMVRDLARAHRAEHLAGHLVNGGAR